MDPFNKNTTIWRQKTSVERFIYEFGEQPSLAENTESLKDLTPANPSKEVYKITQHVNEAIRDIDDYMKVPESLKGFYPPDKTKMDQKLAYLQNLVAEKNDEMDKPLMENYEQLMKNYGEMMDLIIRLNRAYTDGKLNQNTFAEKQKEIADELNALIGGATATLEGIRTDWKQKNDNKPYAIPDLKPYQIAPQADGKLRNQLHHGIEGLRELSIDKALVTSAFSYLAEYPDVNTVTAEQLGININSIKKFLIEKGGQTLITIENPQNPEEEIHVYAQLASNKNAVLLNWKNENEADVSMQELKVGLEPWGYYMSVDQNGVQRVHLDEKAKFMDIGEELLSPIEEQPNINYQKALQELQMPGGKLGVSVEIILPSEKPEKERITFVRVGNDTFMEFREPVQLTSQGWSPIKPKVLQGERNLSYLRSLASRVNQNADVRFSEIPEPNIPREAIFRILISMVDQLKSLNMQARLGFSSDKNMQRQLEVSEREKKFFRGNLMDALEYYDIFKMIDQSKIQPFLKELELLGITFKKLPKPDDQKSPQVPMPKFDQNKEKADLELDEDAKVINAKEIEEEKGDDYMVTFTGIDNKSMSHIYYHNKKD